MKWLIIIFLIMGNSLIGSSNLCQSQTTEEWLKQKKTQRKYLLQQIAALKMYIGYAQKGYTITQNGLKTIRQLKNGEWHLHSDFLGSLNNINPKIQNYHRIADILALQVKIIQTYKSTYSPIQLNNILNSIEADYIFRVYSTLLHDCATDIEELTTLITADKLEMTDDERIKRMDGLYHSMQDKYAFAKSFSEEAEVLAIQQMQEKKEVQNSWTLYGFKPE